MVNNNNCPTCGGRLHAVRNTSEFLNDEQSASQRAGDFYCPTCPPNGRSASNRYCYWWRSEVAAPTPAPRDEAVFQRLADAVDEITAKVARGEAITPLDAGKAHVALRAYQNHRAALRGTTDDKKGG